MEKRILIAIDKFKGSLTSLQAADVIKRGIENNSKDVVFDIVPIADGGDGSADVIKSVVPGVEEVKTVAVNPLGKEIETAYLLYSNPDRQAVSSFIGDSASKSAFIEMAKVSGLALIDESERSPLITTTYGLGQLVKDAYLRGAREITLSIGGSATNDGGTGMLQALGFKFYDKNGVLITDYMCGGLLGEIGRIEIPSGILKECKINVVCDVTNPLLGSNGATYVYGPQKGATAERLQILERGMENYAAIAKECALAGKCRKESISWEQEQLVDMHLVEGAGAAGGVGFAVIRFLKGNLINGWKFFAEITNLKERIAWADVVISGEGKIDSQSFSGKVIDGIFTMVDECNKEAVASKSDSAGEDVSKQHKEVLLFCGMNELDSCGKDSESIHKIPIDYNIYSLKSIEPDTQKCMQNAAALLERLANISWDR